VQENCKIEKKFKRNLEEIYCKQEDLIYDKNKTIQTIKGYVWSGLYENGDGLLWRRACGKTLSQVDGQQN